MEKHDMNLMHDIPVIASWGNDVVMEVSSYIYNDAPAATLAVTNYTVGIEADVDLDREGAIALISYLTDFVDECNRWGSSK